MSRKAIIPAAGLGTRFLPISKAVPKEMLPILDRPVLDYVVEEAVNSGFTDIGIIINKDKDVIRRYFEPDPAWIEQLERKGKIKEAESLKRIENMARIQFILQPEQKGLGDAILQARDYVGNEPFAVLLGDNVIEASIPLAGQLWTLFETEGAPVVALEKASRDVLSLYGVVDVEGESDGVYEIRRMVEKPAPHEAPSDFVIVGRYILTSDILDELKETAPAPDGEIRLTDALLRLMKHRRFLGYHFVGTRHDIGSKNAYYRTVQHFARLQRDLW